MALKLVFYFQIKLKNLKMALPKKGLRKIIVNGEQFVWKVRKKATHSEEHNQPLSIPIQYIDGDGEGGQLLLATIPYARAGYGTYRLREITPALIEKCIKRGIQSGWQYKQAAENGKYFGIDCLDLVEQEDVGDNPNN